MTIRQRISLLVVLVFLAVLGIGGFAISQLRQSTQQVAQVTGVSVPSVLASADLVAELKDVQIALMAYMSAPDAGVQEDAKNELDHARAQLQRAIDEQIKAAAGEKQRALTDQVSVSLQNYFSAIDDTLRFRQRGAMTWRRPIYLPMLRSTGWSWSKSSTPCASKSAVPMTGPWPT